MSTPRRPSPWRSDRGAALISSYMLLMLFLVYTNTLTMRTLMQRIASDRLRDRIQALNLARAAQEQLREDLYGFLKTEVYFFHYHNDAVRALQWLDHVVDGQSDAAGLPFRNFPVKDTNADGKIDWQDSSDDPQGGIAGNPLCITGLATITRSDCQPTANPVGAPRSWIEKVEHVDPSDPLSSRRVTIISEATVGSVNRQVRATYDFSLGMSDIFRYAYFVNNYGWFDFPRDTKVHINGEVRANGDLNFHNNAAGVIVNGDLYAAKNPEMRNPETSLNLGVDGTITGDPRQDSMEEYWYWKDWAARPTRRLTFPGQPAIGGTPKTLPEGYGYDAEYGDQHRFESQQVQPIPYLGDLELYKSLAARRGGQLTYNKDPGPDNEYGTADDVRATIHAVYTGPDNQPNDSDDTEPLILVGTPDQPIRIDGPVVVPGDVIIKGIVSGRGTIYAGRNTHIVGGIYYETPINWFSLERNTQTGMVRQLKEDGNGQVFGTVCDDGSYFTPQETAKQVVPKQCAGKKP